jgi:hypothetical protein
MLIIIHCFPRAFHHKVNKSRALKSRNIKFTSESLSARVQGRNLRKKIDSLITPSFFLWVYNLFSRPQGRPLDWWRSVKKLDLKTADMKKMTKNVRLRASQSVPFDKYYWDYHIKGTEIRNRFLKFFLFIY